MNDSLKRNTFIDISKGVAIFLMLWGHCIQYCGGSNYDFFGNLIFKAIYSFHMPLFALISGYLFFFSFSKRDLKELLTIRLKSLLKPIIFCSVLHFLIFNVLLELKNGNFDLFHIHSPFTIGSFAVDYAKKNNIPTVITMHSQFYQDFMRATNNKTLSKFLLKQIVKVFDKADYRLTMNPFTKKLLQSYGSKKHIGILKK